MACATLKRPHDWDPLGSPNNSPTSNGGSSSSNTTSSHHHQRPAKKHCSNHSHPFPLREPSPFLEVEPKITADEISVRINEEVRRLASRRQLVTIPQQQSTSPFMVSSQPSSPSMFGRPTGFSASPMTQPFNTSVTFSPEKLSATSCSSPAVGLLAPGRREQPIFTFKQVSLICERLLREREAQLREEYDKILGQKLAEQYDTFVKFTYDQIQKGFEAGPTPSYLS